MHWQPHGHHVYIAPWHVAVHEKFASLTTHNLQLKLRTRVGGQEREVWHAHGLQFENKSMTHG
jgi:hypothetical protein